MCLDEFERGLSRVLFTLKTRYGKNKVKPLKMVINRLEESLTVFKNSVGVTLQFKILAEELIQLVKDLDKESSLPNSNNLRAMRGFLIYLSKKFKIEINPEGGEPMD